MSICKTSGALSSFLYKRSRPLSRSSTITSTLLRPSTATAKANTSRFYHTPSDGSQPGDPFSMMKSNHLRASFDRNEGASWGFWQTYPNTNISRTFAHSEGVSWVLVDCEHGQIDDGAMHELVPAIAAAGASPIVRTPGMDDWMIKRALDSGAHGVLVPLIRSAEEAKCVVAASRFPPHGRRGFGTALPLERFTPQPSVAEYIAESHKSLLTMVQIETKEALDSVDEIAAVEGLDVLFIGPFDLGLNIGHPVQGLTIPPELGAAMEKIRVAAQKAGKKCGVFCASGEAAGAAAAQGFDMVNVMIDYIALGNAVQQELQTAKAGAAAGKSGGGA